MATWRERLGVCEAALRAHLDPGERVLGVGTCEDVTERGGIEAGGHGRTFVMVTDRRLRWVPGANLGLETSLEFDAVTAVYERSQAHRWAIALEHAPLARPHHVPAHHLLRFAWGNAVSTAPLTRTVLAFSRRDTKAALALRGRLSRCGSL